MATPRKKLRMRRGDADGWCSQDRTMTDMPAEKISRDRRRWVRLKAKRVRCPKCGRRMKAQAVDVEPLSGDGEYWFAIPRHKVSPAKR